MLPWGHAGVGYAGYHLWLRLRHRLPPEGAATLALIFGTQFPDLIDKPAAWIFEIFPSGRTLGHSALTLGIVTVILVVYLQRSPSRNERAWLAFLGGWLAHILGDASRILFDPDSCVRYLLWPIVSDCPGAHNSSAIAWMANFEFDSWKVFGLAFTLLALILWWADGRPGLGVLRSLLPLSEHEDT